jgi:hypothetical protein
MNAHFNLFKKQITNPINYRLFMLSKLPMGFMSGLKIIRLTHQDAIVGVRFKWMNQNPFKSIYFAVLSMAAELSTGVLAYGQIYKRNPNVSMLVVKLEAEFYKKAVGEILFTCVDGDKIAASIEACIQSNQARSLECVSIGRNSVGEEVAKFILTWSFKSKN